MGHIILAITVGFLIAVCFWYPFLGLERVVIGRADSSLRELKEEIISDICEEQELHGNYNVNLDKINKHAQLQHNFSKL